MNALMRSVVLLILALVVAGLAVSTRALVTTMEEARLVAGNQVKRVIAETGSWGGHADAEVTSIDRFRRDGRLIGYVCQIAPVGYIVVSPLRELAPIRAYSVRSRLDPNSDSPLTELLADWQGTVYRGIDARLGRAFDPEEDLRTVIPVDFRPSWTTLLDPAFAPPSRAGGRARGAGIDYQEGEVLLSSTWHQNPPYNDQCPDHDCSWPEHAPSGHPHYNENCWAGCVATAGAQVCRYWNWPLTGTGSGYDMAYDWANMADHYFWSDADQDMRVLWGGVPRNATQAEVDAVALLLWKVGTSVGMDYGCGASSAHTWDLESALPNRFRYHTLADVANRDDYDYMEWVSLLVAEFDNNRPSAYRIDEHAIVVDGWDEQDGSYFIHVVYGHNGSNDGWFTVGTIPGGGPADEQYVVRNLTPAGVVGSLDGTYDVPTYPYRYFGRDLEGIDGEFAAGHNIQVLGSGLLLTATDAGSAYSVRFLGAPGAETNFYINGDPVHQTEINIRDGMIKMTKGGQVAFY